MAVFWLDMLPSLLDRRRIFTSRDPVEVRPLPLFMTGLFQALFRGAIKGLFGPTDHPVNVMLRAFG
jgi:hypothetical protein